MNISIVDLIILGLATWRVSSLIVNEEGPFNIFVRIRELSGIVHDDDNKPWVVPDRFFAKLLSCVWCASVWVGFFLTTLYYISPTVAIFLGLFLSLSAVAIVSEKQIGKTN